MKVLLDTCVWGGAKDTLVAAGHDVVRTGDRAEDPGDEEILAEAHRDERVLVTLTNHTARNMSQPSFPSWRDAFLDVVQQPTTAAPLKAASLAEDLRAWTACLTSAVVASCRQIGWLAAAKGHRLSELPQAGQEYLGIDVMAFSAEPGPGRWRFPIAVFELENHRTDDRVAYSLWKVLCVRAPLRVVFAFRRDWEASRRSVNAICEDVIGSLSVTERAALSGETMLVIGNRGDGETFPWGYFKFWMLDPNVGRFDKV